jgi:hypothetical protein
MRLELDPANEFCQLAMGAEVGQRTAQVMCDTRARPRMGTALSAQYRTPSAADECVRSQCDPALPAWDCLDHAELPVYSALTSAGRGLADLVQLGVMARQVAHTVGGVTYEPTDPYRIALAA